jgi:transketolase
MALHGGVIPYGGTFLVFSDYCRPSIRLAALMGAHTIFVMTHDSIGVGEDGPTHEPVEHLAALRAIPNLLVMRPADGVEVAECWQIAMESKSSPSLLALSRQDTVLGRDSHTADNLSARGAYVLREAPDAKLTLLATGTEVGLALKARDLLAADGIAARVVSMPCWALFEKQPGEYRRMVLGPGTARLAIEAACPLGWDRYLGEKGAFLGMHGFGASGPAKDVYAHFGITAEAAVQMAKDLLK